MREIENEKQKKEMEARNQKPETRVERVEQKDIAPENVEKFKTPSIFEADGKKETADAGAATETNAAGTTPEITLSEEELDAMYARFCQRLQEQGLADADGNPTEKTLELRKKAVERVEREKQEQEKQKQKQQKRELHEQGKQEQEQQKCKPLENGQQGYLKYEKSKPEQQKHEQERKSRRVVKHGKTVAKAAGLVLVVGACVFGASMTSEANRIRLVETVHGVWNGGDATGTNNGEERKYSAGSLDEATKEIKDELHIAVPEFYYVPAGMKYSNFTIISETQIAVIQYQYQGRIVYFHLAANDKDLSQGNWKDKEKIQIETLDDVIDVEMGTVSENEEDNYYVQWQYKDAYYQLSGQIEKEELLKILSEMQYNL